MAAPIKMKQLLETGVHFGHRTQKWNPKMEPFIFTKRNGIHIIDLQQTLALLHQYYDLVRGTIADGGTLMFVGTKRQAQEIIAREATRCNMAYVNHRWLGGTLTNWRTIRERINTLKSLEKRRDAGEFELLTKKEALILERKIAKLQLRLGGVRDMKRLPDLMLVVDTEREDTAVKEANILKIPVLGVVDTNADPDQVDYIIPANDDAMRSINLLVGLFASAVIEGQMLRKSDTEDDDDTVDEIDLSKYADEDLTDEDLLGESTLRTLRDARLFEEGNDDDDDDDDDDYDGGDDDDSDDD